MQSPETPTMSHLEDEFRSLLITHTTPTPLTPSSDSSTHSESTHFHNFPISTDSPNFSTPQNSFDKQFDHQESTASNSCYKSSTSIRELDLLPSDTISTLRDIASKMIKHNSSRELIQVYSSVRKPGLDSTLRELNIEKLSIGEIQKLDWEVLETKIRRWIRGAKICVRLVFASERKLCSDIFAFYRNNNNNINDDDDDNYNDDVNDNDDVKDDYNDNDDDGDNYDEDVDSLCFMETVKGSVSQLFNFAEAISISKRSPEKLFKILDLYDCLSELMVDIEAVFDESVRVNVMEILDRLGEAVRGILSEFENAVLKEPSKVPVPGGTIHPLTRYVMNYISLISDYKKTLVELIVCKPSMSRYSGDGSVPDVDLEEYEGNGTVLALHLIWVIVILQFNLDGKSKHYKDASLGHLFVMNNVHYIVEKIKGSPELREMIGDRYLRRMTGKFRNAATSYQRATWVGVLYCLRDEGLHVSGSFSSGVSKSALRERFKSFNAMFEDVHRTQATWLIPDMQLREELRISMSEHLIPAYRSFLGRFRSHIESGRHPENYIKYSVEDLENAVLDFFEGYAVSQHLRRRSP